MLCTNKTKEKSNKQLGLWDSGNSSYCGVIISEKLVKELELDIDTRHNTKFGSAVDGQYLKIIGIAKDIQFRTRVNIMKKLEMNIQYSATGPAVFSFANETKQMKRKWSSEYPFPQLMRTLRH